MVDAEQWPQVVLGDYLEVLQAVRPAALDAEKDVLLHTVVSFDPMVRAGVDLRGDLTSVRGGDLLVSEQEVRLVQESSLPQVSSGFLALRLRGRVTAPAEAPQYLEPALARWLLYAQWQRPAERKALQRAPQQADRALRTVTARIPSDIAAQQRLAALASHRMEKAERALAASTAMQADLRRLESQLADQPHLVQQLKRAAELNREILDLWRALGPILLAETLKGAL